VSRLFFKFGSFVYGFPTHLRPQISFSLLGINFTGKDQKAKDWQQVNFSHTENRNLFKKRIYEFIFVENLQVFNTFPYSNIFHGDLELVADAYYHSTFCGTVKFGNGK